MVTMWSRRDSVIALLCLVLLGTLGSGLVLARRNASRSDDCQNNLRQFAIGLIIFGERDPAKRYCNGAYDYMRDGCPDVKGWVGNLVKLGAAKPGEMLCADNKLRGIEKLNELIGYSIPDEKKLSTPSFPGLTLEDYGVDINGGPATAFCANFDVTATDGQLRQVPNPNGTLRAGTPERIGVVNKAVFDGYNTNYAASWFLARMTTRTQAGTPRHASTKVYTRGDQRDLSGAYPGLQVRYAEKAKVATSCIPMLGDASPAESSTGTLFAALSKTLSVGDRLTRGAGDGPADLQANMTLKLLSDSSSNGTDDTTDLKSLLGGDMLPIPDGDGSGGIDFNQDGKQEPNVLGAANAYGGADGRLFLQDTRAWSSLHRDGQGQFVNIVFADGSVKQIYDANGDGYINPGFPIDTTVPAQRLAETVGYTNNRCEVGPTELFSGPFLDDSAIKKARYEGGGGNSYSNGGGSTPSPGAPWPSQLSGRGAADSGRYGPGDKYEGKVENGFKSVSQAPLSTFSIDVDTASYTKVRQTLLEYNQLPPPDAVRVEEFINYFDYSYSPPNNADPFAVHLAATECPWETSHKLVRIGLKGREFTREKEPTKNLVFLIDVSGSMSMPNKLPLVQKGLHLLVDQLREEDRVAIAVYAGNAGLVLPSTPGSEKQAIKNAIERLHAGGSTNGGEGIRLAYQVLEQNRVENGVNRVILCTDGDFNVGVTSTSELVGMAAAEAKKNLYLTLLGFGMGNLNDPLLEELSKHANGNYYFVDAISEARKVLVDQMSGTVVPIAKDVKIQVEFNPQLVSSYRLVGYENRLLADRDFNDDKKDAGEIGAGHSVTALYEIVPAHSESGRPDVDKLKYQRQPETTAVKEVDREFANEWLTVKLRYKPVDADKSNLIEVPLQGTPSKFVDAPADVQLAVAVAMFGQVLSRSKNAGNSNLDAISEIASSAKWSGKATDRYRAEFLQLVQAAKTLSRQ